MRKVKLLAGAIIAGAILFAMSVSAEESESIPEVTEPAVTTTLPEEETTESAETETTAVTEEETQTTSTEVIVTDVTESTTVETTTEPEVTTTEPIVTGMLIDDSNARKFYYSDEKEFDKTGIVVYYDGIDVTEEAEVKYENIPSYDNKTFDYTAKYTVTYNGESYAREIAVQIGLKGDTNLDHEIDVFDAVYIARYTVSNPKFPIEENTLRYFLSDMSSPKNQIDVFDAIWIARKSNEFAPEPKPVRPTLHMPKEKDYNTNTIAGLKKYVNDCIVYKAARLGLYKVYFDDSVDEWAGGKWASWDAPVLFINDMEGFLKDSGGYYPFLEAGPVFDKNYKSPPTKDGAIPAMRRVESMYNEWKSNWEDSNEEITQGKSFEQYIREQGETDNTAFNVKWKHLGHNNFQIYIMW